MMQNWAVILGNSLDGMFNRIRMNRLIFQLEELHVKDVVTGLYNRSGYEKYAKELFEKAKREKKEFFIAMVDLDGLKQINDQFGHSEGDIAIIEIARALRNAGNGREICARMGGDEYSVAALYTKEQSAQYMKDFETCLNRTNMDLGKNYTIAASVGYTTEIPDERDTLESFLKISDNLMYQQKCIRKKKKYK